METLDPSPRTKLLDVPDQVSANVPVVVTGDPETVIGPVVMLSPTDVTVPEPEPVAESIPDPSMLRPVPTFTPPSTEPDAMGSVYDAPPAVTYNVPSTSTPSPDPTLIPPSTDEVAMGRVGPVPGVPETTLPYASTITEESETPTVPLVNIVGRLIVTVPVP